MKRNSESYHVEISSDESIVPKLSQLVTAIPEIPVWLHAFSPSYCGGKINKLLPKMNKHFFLSGRIDQIHITTEGWITIWVTADCDGYAILIDAIIDTNPLYKSNLNEFGNA